MVWEDTVIRYEHQMTIKDKVEGDYKERKGYRGLDWAYTDMDRKTLRIEMEQAILEAQAEISFKAGQAEERKNIIQWLKDLGADEYMIGRLNNEMIVKSLGSKPS